jgi:hypothetical protein
MSRSWNTKETLPQVLERLENTCQLKFPTNIQVVNWKAWWQSSPRSSDIRYTAIQLTCDETAWRALRSSIGTNFVESWSGSAPYGQKLQQQVPWISVVAPTWQLCRGRLFTRDQDQWLRVHGPEIYFDPESNPTNRNVIIYVQDFRAEINEPSYY